MPVTSSRMVADLRALVGVMQGAEGFAEVREALGRGESAAIDGAWGSACALAAAALVGGGGALGEEGRPRKGRRAKESAGERDEGKGPVLLVVVPRISEVDDFALDLSGFLGRSPEIVPAWESVPRA